MSYVVVEGLDYSGKSTFVKKLASRIKSRVTQEPFGESYISGIVRQAVRNAIVEPLYETQLLIAGRIELFKQFNNYMQDNSSTVLVSDRSFVSNIVYQSEHDNDLERILKLNEQSLRLYGYNIFPDVIVYLHIPFSEAVKRAKERGDANALDKHVLSSEGRYNAYLAKYEKALALTKERSKGKTKIITLMGDSDSQNHDAVLNEVIKIINDKNVIPVKQLA